MPTTSLFGSGHEVMTRAERVALPAPAAGQLVYESDTRTFSWYTGALWTGLVPPGTVSAHTSTTAPAGWLFCNGDAVLRATYPDLFAVLGTQYNTGGEASTHFALPDLRGRRPAGIDNLGGSAANRLTYTAATSRGTKLGHRSVPSHFHSFSWSGTTGNDSPDHGHQWPLCSSQGGRDGNDTPARSMYGWDGNFRTGWRAVGGYNASDRPHQHYISISGNCDTRPGSGESINTNLPPFMTLTYVIKI